MSVQKLNDQLAELTKIKVKLDAKKAKGPLTPAESTQYQDTVSQMFDINEELEALAVNTLVVDLPQDTDTPQDAAPIIEGYVVPKGEEDLVHAQISRGPMFDQNTGKLIGTEYVQKFSPKEFAGFKLAAPTLGYTVKVLYEPK